MTVTVLNEEIADLLHDYNRAKKRAKEAKTEMLRIAIEELGMDQRDAMNIDIATFLDGYLVGRGMQQSWRDIGEPRT